MKAQNSVALKKSEENPAIQYGAAENARSPNDSVRTRGGQFHLLEELKDELEGAVESIIVRSKPAGSPADRESGSEGEPETCTTSRKLFFEIASSYCRPVKDLIFELRRGSAGREWIEYCRPALKAILSGTRQLQLQAESIRLLEEFDKTLGEAESRHSAHIESDFRERLLSDYGKLNRSLPQIFGLGEAYSNREKLILESLLFQIAGVSVGTVKKICAAGLFSLEAMFKATPEELSEVTGVTRQKCRAICGKFQQHKEWLAGVPPEKLEKSLKEKILELANSLREGTPQRARKSSRAGTTGTVGHLSLLTQREKANRLFQIRLLLAELHRTSLAEKIPGTRLSQLLNLLQEFALSS